MIRASDKPVFGLAAAKEKAGNQRRLAIALGISAAAVHAWGDEVPEKWIDDVARVTGLSKTVLRRKPQQVAA